jgi:hypothetical protein
VISRKSFNTAGKVIMSVALAIIGFQNLKLAIILLVVGGIIWSLSHDATRAMWANGTHVKKFVVSVSISVLVLGFTGGLLVGRFILAPVIKTDMITGWGGMPPTIEWLTADTTSIIEDKGKFKVLFICRASDASIDEMRDTILARSPEYEISATPITMQLSMDQAVMHRLVATDGWMAYYLIEIPEKVVPEQIVTLLSLEALGGKILDRKGRQQELKVLTTPTPQATVPKEQ